MYVEPREWCFAAVLKVCDGRTRPAGLGPYTDGWWRDLQTAINAFVRDQGLIFISGWQESFYDAQTRRARVRSAHLKQSHIAFSTYPEHDIISLWLVSCKPLDYERCVRSLQKNLDTQGFPATVIKAEMTKLEFSDES